jgi:hypothetical protein
VRQLCTAAEVVPVVLEKRKRLYKRLSELGASGESVSKTLNDFVLEGGKTNKVDLLACIRELRKYGRFDYAIEVHLSVSVSFVKSLDFFTSPGPLIHL